MDEKAMTVMAPMMQVGFAATTAVCFGIIVWMIKQFVNILKENNKVISSNTQAIQSNTMAVMTVDERLKDVLKINVECKNELLARPCIAKFKQVEQ
jgi:hypothetical protein